MRVESGLAQTAARCSLRPRRDLDVEIIQFGIMGNADTEPRVCASLGYGPVRPGV